MNLENENSVLLVVVIAVALIVIVWLAKKVGFTLDKNSLSLKVDKTSKDTVNIENIHKSDVEVESRQGLDTNIKNVKGGSNVKVKK